jgi:hypothetical protein
MKRILTVLMAMLIMAAMVVVMAMPAFAAISDGPGKGNPATNVSGKCPAGQNKDTSPGGLKKCNR